ncbi:MAG: hypothetical protein HY000_19640 [Planctomycetes bacterium]|nr:hypothetical protein [Planctomycetota bacterium]
MTPVGTVTGSIVTGRRVGIKPRARRLIVEVKPLLEAERDRRAARRQAFDYAHRSGVRFVVIWDGDFYEVFDRCCGERLRYDEMRQGNFSLTSLRSRDADLLSVLASER